jgi:hypothetical protein
VATYEIPTSARAERFSILLASIVYRLTLHWCAPLASWVLDIADSGGVALVCGLPVIPGVDLLAQHRHLGIGGHLFAVVDGDACAAPSFTGLGSTGHLYFVTA